MDQGFFRGDDAALDRLIADIMDPEFPAHSLPPCSHARELIAAVGSSEAMTMDGPMLPELATVEPDHLLRLWEGVDRCAQIAAECFAADQLRTQDLVVSIPAAKATYATELWLTLQDATAAIRLGSVEEWSE